MSSVSQECLLFRGRFPVRSTARLGSSEYAAPGGRRPSVNDLIRAQQERRGDREAKGFRGLEVDDQLELRGLIDGKISRFGALQDSIDIGGGPAGHFGEAGT